VCSHCKMIIDNEDQFHQHLQKHCNPANANGGQVAFPTSCIICRQTLVSDIEVKVHVHYHLSRVKESPAVCGNCNRYKRSASSPCDGCNPTRNSAAERCPDCGAAFDAFGALQHHLTTVHRKPFHCFKCKVSSKRVHVVCDPIRKAPRKQKTHQYGYAPTTVMTPRSLYVTRKIVNTRLQHPTLEF